MLTPPGFWRGPCSLYLDHRRISPFCSLLGTACSYAWCPAQQLGGLPGSQIGRHITTIHTTPDGNKDSSFYSGHELTAITQDIFALLPHLREDIVMRAPP